MKYFAQFQACNLQEAERLYDQLAPLCPIMLSLTAATPIFRGFLSDVDCRWDIISASVDCRTKQERGLEELTTERFVIPKSRYDSISRLKLIKKIAFHFQVAFRNSIEIVCEYS